VKERDGTLRSLAGDPVDHLDAVELEPGQGRVDVRHLEAHVVEPLALRLQEPGDPGRLVGGLDELHLRLPDRKEGDRDPIALDREHQVDGEAEHVAPEAQAVVDVADDDGDVVDLAETPDTGRDAIGGLGLGHPGPPQTVISSRWTPQTARSRSEISPTVA
jgi:hypothetical protein